MSFSKKIVLLGHFSVGKTSLLRRFIDDQFSEEYIVTIGVQVKKKVVTVKHKEKQDISVSFIIWDIEGNKSVKSTRKSYLLGTHGFIYVFDVNNDLTYKNTLEEIDYLKSTYPNVLVKVVGNKIDLVNAKNIENELALLKIPVDILTSAKTGENIDFLFKKLAEEFVNG